jgi:hypothetical protein
MSDGPQQHRLIIQHRTYFDLASFSIRNDMTGRVPVTWLARLPPSHRQLVVDGQHYLASYVVRDCYWSHRRTPSFPWENNNLIQTGRDYKKRAKSNKDDERYEKEQLISRRRLAGFSNIGSHHQTNRESYLHGLWQNYISGQFPSVRHNKTIAIASKPPYKKSGRKYKRVV